MFCLLSLISIIIAFPIGASIDHASTCHGENVRMGLSILFLFSLPLLFMYLSDATKSSEEREEEYKMMKRMEPAIRIAALFLMPGSSHHARVYQNDARPLLCCIFFGILGLVMMFSKSCN